jgi:uncharacterized protein YcbX
MSSLTSEGGEPREPGALGTVVSVASFPLKSAAGARLREILIDPDGVRGDRRYAVVDGSGAVLTVADLPGLRDIVAGIGADGALWVDLPGRAGAAGASPEVALSDVLGVPVSVATLPAGSQLDAPVHLVSTQSVEAARRGEHAVADCACSIEEPRANIVLGLTGGVAREESWPEALDGALITVGEVVLRVLRRPGHCLGVYAEVDRPGTVRVGDLVATAR